MPKVTVINTEENELVGDRVRLRISRLDTLEAVRSEMSRLYAAGRRGEVDASDAAKLNTILTSVASMIKNIGLEARLSEVEKRLLAEKAAGGRAAFGRPRPVA